MSFSATETLTQLTRSNKPLARLQQFLGTDLVMKEEEIDLPYVAFNMDTKGLSEYGKVKIILMPSDTYNMVFYTHDNKEELHSDVYCDQLTELFETVTGLYLSL